VCLPLKEIAWGIDSAGCGVLLQQLPGVELRPRSCFGGIRHVRWQLTRAPEGIELALEHAQRVSHRLVAIPARAHIQWIHAKRPLAVGDIQVHNVVVPLGRYEAQCRRCQIAVRIGQDDAALPGSCPATARMVFGRLNLVDGSDWRRAGDDLGRRGGGFGPAVPFMRMDAPLQDRLRVR
jgi:hypothetical protein